MRSVKGAGEGWADDAGGPAQAPAPIVAGSHLERRAGPHVRRHSVHEPRIGRLGWGLALALVLLTLLATGPLLELDRALNVKWADRWPEPREPLSTFLLVGQRAICLPVLFLLAAYLSRQLRSWRPLLVTAVSVLSLNAFVGIFKLLTARGTPRSENPAFFQDGVMYPSGHTANVVFVYGLAVYLLSRYGKTRGQTVRRLAVLVVVLATVMVVDGLYFRWHWFTDLISGLLAGALVLRLTVIADRRSSVASGAEGPAGRTLHRRVGR